MENFFNWEELTRLITAYAPKVIGALLTLVVGFWIIGRITNIARRAMERNKLDQSVTPFLSSIINVGLKILLLISVAGMFGVETTSFIAIFSALTLAIGFALQGSLGHFASGVLILIFKPYKVSDLVSIGGGQTGTVEEIQVFNTVLKTLDNKRIIVPNGVVTNNVITNISGQGILGVELSFSISYQDSIDRAREIILQVANECPHILKEPATAVVVGPWGNSAIHLASRPFCKSENYWQTYFYMHEHVKKAFDANGISIPFPQMDVHVRQPAKP